MITLMELLTMANPVYYDPTNAMIKSGRIGDWQSRLNQGQSNLYGIPSPIQNESSQAQVTLPENWQAYQLRPWLEAHGFENLDVDRKRAKIQEYREQVVPVLSLIHI